MKKALTLLALAMASAVHAGTPAPAPVSPTVDPENISYSNLSLSWQRAWGTVGPVDMDSNGIALALEYSPVEHFYLALNGSWNDVEFSAFGAGLDGDFWTLNAGVGGYVSLTSNIDFVTEIGGSYSDLSVAGVGSGDDGGVYVTPHFRAKFGAFETHLGATFNSNDAAFAEWSTFLRLLYEVCPNVDVFATGTLGLSDTNGLEDFVGLNVGLRYKF
jgi:hypothetical protein